MGAFPGLLPDCLEVPESLGTLSFCSLHVMLSLRFWVERPPLLTLSHPLPWQVLLLPRLPCPSLCRCLRSPHLQLQPLSSFSPHLFGSGRHLYLQVPQEPQAQPIPVTTASPHPESDNIMHRPSVTQGKVLVINLDFLPSHTSKMCIFHLLNVCPHLVASMTTPPVWVLIISP